MISTIDDLLPMVEVSSTRQIFPIVEAEQRDNAASRGRGSGTSRGGVFVAGGAAGLRGGERGAQGGGTVRTEERKG